MTDQPQTIPTDQVRKIIARYRDGASYQGGRILAALKDLLPTPQTLADMAPEERRDCQWMQADTKPWGRVVILVPDLSDGRAALLDIWGDVAYEPHTDVTPRPDLPRLEWPVTEPEGDK